MVSSFQVASGSISGGDHTIDLRWSNNQDALAIRRTEDSLICIVADGGSNSNEDSPSHSEVGSRVGSQILLQCLTERLELWMNEVSVGLQSEQQFPWASLATEVVGKIKTVAELMGGDFRRTIIDNFLFTLVCAVITPYRTFLFSIGDGVMYLNGERIHLGPFPNNQPPYIGYRLVPSTINCSLLEFDLRASLPTQEVSSLLIGTDGVGDLIKARALPAASASIPEISDFWTKDDYFDNQDQVRRVLALNNRRITKVDWEKCKMGYTHPVCPDDTTLVAVRRNLEKGN